MTAPLDASRCEATIVAEDEVGYPKNGVLPASEKRGQDGDGSASTPPRARAIRVDEPLGVPKHSIAKFQEPFRG